VSGALTTAWRINRAESDVQQPSLARFCAAHDPDVDVLIEQLATWSCDSDAGPTYPDFTFSGEQAETANKAAPLITTIA
jgi:hypothetical protein